MKIAILGLTNVTKTVALAPNATGCSGTVAGTFCTIAIDGLTACPSSGNCYVSTMATYDTVTGCPSACAIPGTAHELSANQTVEFTVALGRTNRIKVTLDGIPASVVLQPGADAALSGNMASGFSLGKCSAAAQHVNVYGLDADGNIILGAGAPIPSLASNDAADLSVAAASPSSPNRFTLTPSATVSPNKVVQLTIGAMPLAASQASPVTQHVNVTFNSAICGVYVADYTGNTVSEILAVGGSVPPSPTIRQLGSGFNMPINLAVDGSGNVYVANIGTAKLQELVAVGGSVPTSPTIRTLASGSVLPAGVALDASGNVYVVDNADDVVREMLAVNGTIPASPTVKTFGSGLFEPQGIAVDASGDVFVADTGNRQVKEIVAVNGSIPASPTINTLLSGFILPTGIAVDSSGNVYVADAGNTVIDEILAVNGSIPASPTVNTLGSGFDAPIGVAVDAAGNVYVADTNNHAVKEIMAVGGTVKTLATGFMQPQAVVVR
jgi:DNA-binding beta-propeller fold protein YncE